ncbi:hypothetical protein JCM3770_003343 [Rhodotorula araucariae]
MASDAAGPAIFRLPPEILIHALAQATPEACAAFACTCTAAHTLVQSTALWRALHRARFDSPTAPGYAFARQVQRRTRAATLLRAFADRAEPIPHAELKPLLETLVDVALSRPPASPAIDSLNEAWLGRWLATARGAGDTLLALHPTFSRSSVRSTRSSSAGKAAAAVASPAALVRAARIAQLAAHLHVLATPTPLALTPTICTAARETVYEWSNFRRESLYGPFMNDGSGRVDWRKVEALAIVMRQNIGEARTFGWGTANTAAAAAGGANGAGSNDDMDPVAPPPRAWASTRAGSAGPLCADPAGRDWAGVTHAEGWCGTYSFLHFPVWVHWNFHRGGPYVPSLADEHEAVGDCMQLHLELLPEGEWPAENGQPDLSVEALVREDGDDDGDDDWDAGSAADDASSTGDESSGNEYGYFATTGGRRAEQITDPPAVELPLPSPPGGLEAEEDAPALSAAQVAALAGPSEPGPLPAAPHTAASAAYPPPGLTFRPVSPSPASRDPSSSAPGAASPTAAAYPKLAFQGTSLPRLGFTGTFTNAGPPSLTPRDRSIRGTVELTPEGYVRWQYIIRYAGMDQWCMSGVQLGGLGSRAGVVGVWSSADRADEGPCGPFWYWPHRADNADVD